jgi:hypothetical protein
MTTSVGSAVEMPRPWTAQTAVHRRLEISHSPRDFHIPTSRVLMGVKNEKNDQTGRLDRRGGLRTG